MAYVQSLRMVTCVMCNRRVTEKTAVRAGAGRNGSVPVWLCKPCAKDPQAGAEKRRVKP